MSKKKSVFRQKVTNNLVSFFVLAAVFLPLALSVKMVLGAVKNHDPRKTQATVGFNTRGIDKSKAPLKPFDEPLVTVTFDDGWGSIYTNAFPELQSEGIISTQYIITNTFDNYTYMSLDQLHAMQKAGHEIASHSVTHPDLTILNQDQLMHELGDSRTTLSKKFGSVADFTSPYGAYNAYTLQTIGKFYRSQKNAEGDPSANELETINMRAGFNPLNFKSYSVRNTTSLEDIQKLLKAAEDNNGWLVLTYHQIDDSGEAFSVSPDAFNKQLRLISDAPMRMTSVGKVFDALLPGWKAQK